MEKKDYQAHIVANGIVGTSGLSGGDNILINLVRFLEKSGVSVDIYTWEDGYELCLARSFSKDILHLWPAQRFSFLGFPIHYLIRTLVGCWQVMRIKPTTHKTPGFVYSASDFWPDSLPGFLMSRRLNQPWVAAFYLFAPSPLSNKSPYHGKKWLIGLFYWLLQQPIYWLVRSQADFILVTSQPDVEKFVNAKRSPSKIIVVRGGVDLEPSKRYWENGEITPVNERKYDACFIGRFHYQKGVLELVDIWQMVCRRFPQAKLAMIGFDTLENELRLKIKEKNLEGNIVLTGPLTGEDKYNVFKQSKMILHPATYDSGGMAAAEAMAWGLPGVSFDLESLKTYYPQGMLKTPCFDLQKFANNILRLLEERELYERLSNDAHELIVREWDWNERSKMILSKILETRPDG